MIRAFLAFLLDPPVRQALGTLQKGLIGTLGVDQDRAVRVQWVHPELMHLTVKFLGDIDPAQVPAMRAALQPIAAGAAPTTLEWSRLGVFPDPRAPRVLWVGAAASPASEAVISLVTGIEQALVPLGWEAERRPFQLHVTLARIKEGGRAVGQALLTTGALDRPLVSLSSRIGRLHLMQSELRLKGPIYTPLWELDLGRSS